MIAHSLNPFRYGKPVPPDRFIGREDALRTVFARINNGESTAVVGAPHIGKSSFLRYIHDERVRGNWLGKIERYVFVDFDCHLLPESYQPADFWREVLDRVAEAFPASPVLQQIEVVRQSGYGSFTLKRWFDLFGRAGNAIVLLVDEFDVLLGHPNFNTAEFFGALRSLAIQTDGLALVTSSRLPVAEMNRRSQEINSLGSPFFNNLIEVRLLPLRQAELDLLIDQALKGSSISFTPDDRAYIARASGRHPFLVQIACAAMFEAIAQSRGAPHQRTVIDSMLQSWALDHFEDVWRHLTPDARRATLFLALMERPATFDTSRLGNLAQYDTDMRWLTEGGLIVTTDNVRCATWRGEHWRINAESFAHWIIDNHKWEDVEGQATVPQPDATERAERVAALRKKLNALHKRLNQRELQIALLGINADPIVSTEIEELKREITASERELRRLGGRV